MCTTPRSGDTGSPMGNVITNMVETRTGQPFPGKKFPDAPRAPGVNTPTASTPADASGAPGRIRRPRATGLSIPTAAPQGISGGPGIQVPRG